MWNPPRGTGCPCVLLVSALGLVGSRRRRGNSTESACSSVWSPFYCQGLTLVSRCSQRPEARLPAAGTPLLQDRPGRGNCLSIGPAAQGCLVWWQYQEPQQGSRADHRLDARQPRTPGGYLGGNALSGFWFLLTGQKEPPAGSVPEGWKKETREGKTFSQCAEKTTGPLHGAAAPEDYSAHMSRIMWAKSLADSIRSAIFTRSSAPWRWVSNPGMVQPKATPPGISWT